MFLSKFRRRNSVVERIEEWTQPPTLPFAEVNAAYHPHKQTITVNVPATVDGALLAHQIEHQLKRHGHA